MERYNGWKNRQTWNIALWIQNDEPLYRMAVSYMKQHPTSKKPYAGFIRETGLESDRTPDNISYKSTRISYAELNSMMRELIS